MLETLRASLPASLRNGSDQAAFLAIAGSVAFALVSIAASQILLAVAIALSLWIWRQRGKESIEWPPFTWPLLAFCLWTLLTIFVSRNVLLAFPESKKFFLYTIPFLASMLVRGRGSATWTYRAIFTFAALSCLKGISQFIANPNRGLLDRISGFMSQWMTYSGLLMLVLVALASFIACFGWRKYKWAGPMALLLVVPLYLAETRSAQWGALAGILTVMLLLKKFRAIVGLLVLILAVYVSSPTEIKHRLRSGFNPDDPNTRNRIELLGTALRLIRDNPSVGVGPKNVGREALRYRGSREWPDWMYQHMHNNALQIAAERGIPGLLIWMWLMGRLAWDALRIFRTAPGPRGDEERRVVSTTALGAWVALLVAGMFEYNFGDSEVLTLFLFMSGVPYSFLSGRDRARRGIDDPACTVVGPIN